MNTIQYDEIDFKKLKHLKVNSTQSKIYTDYLKTYKILNPIPDDKLENKMKKIEFFSSIQELDCLLKAETMILKQDKLKGYINSYIENTILEQLKEDKGIITTLLIARNISKDLQKLHRLAGKPIMGDVNFGNFIVDSQLNHYFLDHDSYGIYGIEPDNISQVLYTYCSYMNYNPKLSSQTDRVSFILHLFLTIFDYHILNISEYMYDQYTEKYPFLKELKETFLDLKMSDYYLPDVPYFHEIVKEPIK